MNLAEAARLAKRHSAFLAGAAAAAVVAEAAVGSQVGAARTTADIRFYARLGATKETGERPKPLYLREADAKPQAGFVLPRIPS
jgi:hypothetical protein